jgi:hypothetical protein
MELGLLCGRQRVEWGDRAAACRGARAANGSSILSISLLTLVPGCWVAWVLALVLVLILILVLVYGGGSDTGGQCHDSKERDDGFVEKHC